MKSADSVALATDLTAEDKDDLHITCSQGFGNDIRVVSQLVGRSIGFVVEYLLKDRIAVLRSKLEEGSSPKD